MTFSGAALLPELPVEPLPAAAAEAVVVGALAVGVALDAADELLGLQADSASPMPRPSAHRLATLVVPVKRRKFVIAPLASQIHQTYLETADGDVRL